MSVHHSPLLVRPTNNYASRDYHPLAKKNAQLRKNLSQKTTHNPLSQQSR